MYYTLCIDWSSSEKYIEKKISGSQIVRSVPVKRKQTTLSQGGMVYKSQRRLVCIVHFASSFFFTTQLHFRNVAWLSFIAYEM